MGAKDLRVGGWVTSCCRGTAPGVCLPATHPTSPPDIPLTTPHLPPTPNPLPFPCSATSLRDDEAGGALLAEHRPGVVPLLIRLLFPKMRKRSGRLGGKGERGPACACREVDRMCRAAVHEQLPPFAQRQGSRA
jgi:hypothetical protein